MRALAYDAQGADIDHLSVRLDPLCSMEPMPGHEAECSFVGHVIDAGEALIGASRTLCTRAERTPNHIARSRFDHLVLLGVVDGEITAVTAAGPQTIRRGDAVVLDLNQAHTLEARHAEMHAFVFPRRHARATGYAFGRLHGTPIGPDLGGILSEHLGLLYRRAQAAAEGEIAAVSLASVSYVTTLLSQIFLTAHPDGADPVGSAFLRACDYIAAHVADPDLSVEALCQAIGVSRAALYRLFKDEGGVRHYIQEYRLECVRRALLDPRETRPIQKIAESYGFFESSHFSHAFRRTYGCAARDLRDRGKLSAGAHQPAKSAERPDALELNDLLCKLQRAPRDPVDHTAGRSAVGGLAGGSRGFAEVA